MAHLHFAQLQPSTGELWNSTQRSIHEESGALEKLAPKYKASKASRQMSIIVQGFPWHKEIAFFFCFREYWSLFTIQVTLRMRIVQYCIYNIIQKLKNMLNITYFFKTNVRQGRLFLKKIHIIYIYKILLLNRRFTNLKW